MFGHHKKRREKRRAKEKESALEKQRMELQNSPERIKQEADTLKQQSSEKAAQSKLEREKARQEGRADTESFLSKEVQGLDPRTRQALQYEANKGIQRSHQSANRKLLGEQASHGIVGKGGVGYAQQRDLMKMADEAKGAANRDLTKLDRDLALKKQAAIFAGGQGEASQQQLDKQIALDELQFADEKRRQRMLEDQFYKQFSRV